MIFIILNAISKLRVVKNMIKMVVYFVILLKIMWNLTIYAFKKYKIVKYIILKMNVNYVKITGIFI